MKLAYQQRGLSLLETLLVMVVFGVILVMGIHRYQSYRETLQTTAVQSDIQVIMQALDRYFFLNACDQTGHFLTDKMNPSMTDLGLAETYFSREPLITTYQAQIIDSDIKTTAQKPIYLLQIIATLKTSSVKKLEWYQQLWQAGQVDLTNHQLIWQISPNQSATSTERSAWVLDGARMIFRQLLNESDSSLSSHHYCAQ